MRHFEDEKHKVFILHKVILDDDGKPIRKVYLDINSEWVDKQKDFSLSADPIVYEKYTKPVVTEDTVLVYKPNKNKYVTVITDVSEVMRAKQNLIKQYDLLKTTLLSLSDGIISVDLEDNVTMMNAAAEKMTGWTRDAAIGKPFNTVFRMVGQETEADYDIPESQYITKENFLVDSYGNMIAVEACSDPIIDEAGNLYGKVIVFRDITVKNDTIRHIEYLSYHDQLTGVYNRRFFDEELKRIDTERNLPISLVMLDVNGLKLTNDAFGHQVGDRLLKKVAHILKMEFRADDIIARIGGDEFAVLLPSTTREEVLPILERIKYAAEHTKLENIVISFSAGHDTKTTPFENILEVFINAENQMYRNKLTESKSMRNRTIQIILNALTEKYIRNNIEHTQVTHWCTSIGRALNFSQEELNELNVAALIYDIGKISISDELLSKPAKLTETEYEKVKKHPEVGYQILKSVDQYTTIAEYALSYHERWDGSGYPRKLVGEQIPRFARILAIADTYEALISERPYRHAMRPCDAMEFIKSKSNTDFDPDMIDVFIDQVKMEERCL